MGSLCTYWRGVPGTYNLTPRWILRMCVPSPPIASAGRRAADTLPAPGLRAPAWTRSLGDIPGNERALTLARNTGRTFTLVSWQDTSADGSRYWCGQCESVSCGGRPIIHWCVLMCRGSFTQRSYSAYYHVSVPRRWGLFFTTALWPDPKDAKNNVWTLCSKWAPFLLVLRHWFLV